MLNINYDNFIPLADVKVGFIKFIRLSEAKRTSDPRFSLKYIDTISAARTRALKLI